MSGRSGDPAKFVVSLSEGAERDLEAIYGYVAEFDSIQSADGVLDRLAGVVKELSAFPERGSHPRELASLGITEFRQVFFKPYRVIYRILGNRVVVTLIADGRRNMQSLLARRLLGP